MSSQECFKLLKDVGKNLEGIEKLSEKEEEN